MTRAQQREAFREAVVSEAARVLENIGVVPLDHEQMRVLRAAAVAIRGGALMLDDSDEAELGTVLLVGNDTHIATVSLTDRRLLWP